jgi:hypothetical protein
VIQFNAVDAAKLESPQGFIFLRIISCIHSEFVNLKI